MKWITSEYVEVDKVVSWFCGSMSALAHKRTFRGAGAVFHV